ncbi:hypothetical protein [Microbispora sp. H10670]|uniref:hypothetical protein n=1 Tax=Microbispora sp. H10670 TaxID=2729108 RepID=UPI001601545A|nr:hypothetical protein [Microbispora sp. H10670]
MAPTSATHNPHLFEAIPEPERPRRRRHHVRRGTWRLFQLSPLPREQTCTVARRPASTRPRQPSGVLLAGRRERQREAAALP